MAAKRPNQRRRRRDPFVYAAVAGATALVRATGPDWLSGPLGDLGDLFGRAPFNRERIARSVQNIRWCFPEMSEARARAVAHESYRHLFMLGAESAMSASQFTFERWPHWIELGDLRDAVRLMLSGPSILITGHCGNWELLGAWLGALGLPLHAVYRPFDNLALDGWVRRTRARLGIHLIDKFGAVEQLPVALAAHEPAAFIADQNAGERGLFAPFFDRLASTYKSIGLLAMQFEAPIVCGAAIRKPRDEGDRRIRFRIEVTDVIKPDDWTDQPDPLFYITARYRRAMQIMIEQAPEQYLWMQKAWRSRPRFEREGRAMPSSLRAKLEALPWMTQASLDRLVSRSEQDAREFGVRASA